MARAKVQEITPVYTVVQPATVPLRAAKPNKIMILIGLYSWQEWDVLAGYYL